MLPDLHSTKPSKQAGFTLIEVMIIILLSSMLMLTASSLFLTMLASKARSATDQILKAEGNYALGRMEFLLRNAVEILPNSSGVTCRQSPVMDDIVIRSIGGGTTRFYQQQDSNDSRTKIASNSGIFLTSSSVESITGPTFSCIQDPESDNRFIIINFTLTKNNRSQNFSTSVNIRNY